MEVVSRGRAGIYKAHLAELGKVLGGEGREDGVYEAVLKALAGLKKGDEGVAIDGCVFFTLSLLPSSFRSSGEG